MVLPLILGMLGGALGPAVGLGALGGAALGSGLGSYAETGDLEKGILTGLGSFAGGALLGPMLGGGASSAAGGASGAMAKPLAGQLATSASPTAMTTMAPGVSPITSAMPTASIMPPTVAPTGIEKLLGPGKLGSTVQRATNFAMSPTGKGAGIGGMLGGALAGAPGGGGGGGKKLKGDDQEYSPLPRTMVTPPTGYRPGFDPEWNYGISAPQSAQDIRNYNAARGFYGGGIVKTLGPVKLAEGGITALTGVDGKEFNSDEGVDAPPGGTEKDVVVDAIKAIKGQLDDPRPALGRFLATYGEDALRDLVDKVREGKTGEDATKGKVEGPGDGMNDRVPARIEDSGEDVLLSDNEYVVPADVVSGLGNGSSDAGARALDEMLNRVRKERTGKTEQPKPVAPEKVMPA